MKKNNVIYEPANVCKCNNCDNIYRDNNPQTNAPEFEVPINLSSLNENLCCPICKTYGYLIDIRSEKEFAPYVEENSTGWDNMHRNENFYP